MGIVVQQRMNVCNSWNATVPTAPVLLCHVVAAQLLFHVVVSQLLWMWVCLSQCCETDSETHVSSATAYPRPGSVCQTVSCLSVSCICCLWCHNSKILRVCVTRRCSR